LEEGSSDAAAGRERGHRTERTAICLGLAEDMRVNQRWWGHPAPSPRQPKVVRERPLAAASAALAARPARPFGPAASYTCARQRAYFTGCGGAHCAPSVEQVCGGSQ